MSRGWLRVQLSLCHPGSLGCLHMSSGRHTCSLAMIQLTHASDIRTRLHIAGPLWWNPIIMRLFDISFVVWMNKLLNKQSRCRWVQPPWRSCDVTVLSLRDIERLSLCSKNINKLRRKYCHFDEMFIFFSTKYHLDNFWWNQWWKVRVSLI